MEILIGLLIIAVGSFRTVELYVPIRKKVTGRGEGFLAGAGHLRMDRLPVAGCEVWRCPKG